MRDTFATASLSAIGARDCNEDCVGSIESPDRGVWGWAVADGLGGHDAGEVAAKAALDAALDCIERSAASETLASIVRSALEASQAAVLQARASAGRNSEMATTLSIVVADEESVAWGHAGDTRIYRFRQDREELLTRDHTIAESMRMLAGNAAESTVEPPHSNVLISSIGTENAFFDVSDAEKLCEGDVFLICSDGLWSAVPAAAVREALQTASSLDDWLSQLQARVELAGDPDQDNYSGIAFRKELGSSA